MINLRPRAPEGTGAFVRNFSAFLSAMIALGIILGGVWRVAHEPIKLGLQDALGIASLREDVQQLREDVNGLSPSPRIAEYDPVRSRVLEPCTPESWCSYVYRLRRTEFGLSCNAATVLQARVRNGRGIPHPTEVRDGAFGRIRGRWTPIRGEFYLPGNVLPGRAEFLIEVSYRDCDGTDAEPIEKTTRPLVFAIPQDS